MTSAISLTYIFLFVACAVTDILYLRIPNAFVLTLLGLFAAVCALVQPPELVWNHIVPGVVAFVLMLPLFFTNKMGGGDVKLLSVAVLWVGFNALGPFLLALAIFGAVAILLFVGLKGQLAAIVSWSAAKVGRVVSLPASLESGKSIPYGVVIAAAAISSGSELLQDMRVL